MVAELNGGGNQISEGSVTDVLNKPTTIRIDESFIICKDKEHTHTEHKKPCTQYTYACIELCTAVVFHRMFKYSIFSLQQFHE